MSIVAPSGTKHAKLYHQSVTSPNPPHRRQHPRRPTAWRGFLIALMVVSLLMIANQFHMLGTIGATPAEFILAAATDEPPLPPPPLVAKMEGEMFHNSSSTGSNATLVPPFIFYCAKDAEQIRRTEKQYRDRCQKINPHYRTFIWYDSDCDEFVAHYFSEFIDLYRSLPQPVMRADMWRYLVLYQYGGVYLDLDVDCLLSIDDWAIGYDRHRIKAVVGIEFRNTDPLHMDMIQFTQWTMASQPRHWIFYRSVEIINETMASVNLDQPPVPESAVHWTGPKVFTRAVVEYLVQQGRLSSDQVTMLDDNVVHIKDGSITSATREQVGDLLILHKNAFGYHFMHNRTEGGMYVRHHFQGRWRGN